MKVTEIGATVRFSKPQPDGSHKTIEVTARGSTDEKESWRTALAWLYSELGSELKHIWANGNGKTKQCASGGPESNVAPSQTVEPPNGQLEPPAHYCQEHQTEFKRNSRGNNVWYSHRLPCGKWCQEGK